MSAAMNPNSACFQTPLTAKIDAAEQKRPNEGTRNTLNVTVGGLRNCIVVTVAAVEMRF